MLDFLSHLDYNIVKQRETSLDSKKGSDEMKKITTVGELMDVLDGDGYFGLRGASEHDIDIADRGYLDCSYDWVDNVMTDNQLNGTCAIGICDFLSADEITKRYKRALSYARAKGTNTVYLLHEGDCEYGEDEHEVILGYNGYGADVIAIVEL